MRSLDQKKEAVCVMQNILVPLDGTTVAEAALPFASAIAARAGAGLTLVHAAQYRSLFHDVGMEQVRAIENGEDYLARIASGLRTYGVPVDTRVPVGGSPTEWIIEESDFRHADLIAMATHDREGPDRWLHGSVAEGIVHRSTVPVMLVRTTTDVLVAQRFEMPEPVLLVPLDGSELADGALPVAGELARAISARVVLLAVVPKPGQLVAGQGGAITTYVGPEHATLEAEAWGCLSDRTERLGQVAGVETAVWYGDVAAQIGAAADQYAAAAVVMATHGRTGPVRSILGSVAGGVVHRSSVPVVLIRPTGVRPAEEPASTESPVLQVGLGSAH
jgi:nucleotide-binding universal stress UspA family protein